MGKIILFSLICAPNLVFGMQDFGQEGKFAPQERGRRIVNIEQDLELGALDGQDEEATQVNAILKSLPVDARASTQDRMEMLSLLVAQDRGAVRSHGKKRKRETAILAYALSEGLKVQTDRNRLLAATSRNSSKIATMGAFIAACTLITNIVNVWLSHTGKK